MPRFAVRVCPVIDWSIAATDGTRQSNAQVKENYEFAKVEIIKSSARGRHPTDQDRWA